MVVRLLSRSDVREVLDIREVIAAVEQAHIAHARDEVLMPVRLTLRYNQLPSEMETMPAHIASLPALGMKLISYVATNAARGLPAINAIVVLVDPDSGQPIAIMDGSEITAMRTAAASAMATSLLARSTASRLAIIGTGVQARSHLWALTAIMAIESVTVWGRNESRADEFMQEARLGYPDVEFALHRDVAGAVAEADVIVTATTSPSPILQWDWVRPGAHINAIGSHSPDTRELATDVVVNSRRVVDSREAALTECGDFLIAIEEGSLMADDIDTEIGQVAAGFRPGRSCDQEVTLYKSCGLALQDVATAHLVLERARERGLGTTFAF